MPDMLPLRLDPGSDLRLSIEAAVRERAIEAAFVVAGIGSLTIAAVRFANAPEPTIIQGPFEILSLQGSVSPDGAHLHIAIADAKGTVCGGHATLGCTIHTTAEILVAAAPGYRFSRTPDARTGHRELQVDTRN